MGGGVGGGGGGGWSPTTHRQQPSMREQNPSVPMVWSEERISSFVIDPVERLRLLTFISDNLPERHLDFGVQDPFGLLEHRDTYEQLAGHIFKECEGIYRTCAANRPDIGKLVRNGAADLRVELPEVKLGDMYTFRMTRTVQGSDESAPCVEYTFGRTDKGYDDKGFVVIQKNDGHIVLRNIKQGDTEIENDAVYYNLLRSSQRFIYDYANNLNIPLQGLLTAAERDFRPYGFRTELGRHATSGWQRAKDLGKTVFTKPRVIEKSGDKRVVVRVRKPRIATLALASCLLPTSFHTILAQNEVGAATAAVSALEPAPSFDSLHLSLPLEATELNFGETSTIRYVSDMNPVIINRAPSAVNKQGYIDMKPGEVRNIPSTSFVDPGASNNNLQAEKCAEPIPFVPALPTNSTIKILNIDPEVSTSLSAKATNAELIVCNTGSKTVNANNLAGIYVQVSS